MCLDKRLVNFHEGLLHVLKACTPELMLKLSDNKNVVSHDFPLQVFKIDLNTFLSDMNSPFKNDFPMGLQQSISMNAVSRILQKSTLSLKCVVSSEASKQIELLCVDCFHQSIPTKVENK